MTQTLIIEAVTSLRIKLHQLQVLSKALVSGFCTINITDQSIFTKIVNILIYRTRWS